MYKKTTLLLVSALLSFQVSNAAVVPRDAVDDATKLLNDLRKAANDALTKAFMDHVSLSDKVDAAAEEAKGDSMDKMLIECVNNHAKEAIIAIYMAAVTVTENSFMPVSDEEKKIVECGRVEEGCLSDVIDELGADLDSVPDAITKEITADSDTIDDHIEMIKACGMASKRQKAVAAKSSAEEAKAALNNLRKVTIDNLNKAFLDYIGASDLVDSTAQKAKDLRDMNEVSDTIADCVNGHADAAIDMIYDAGITLTKTFLMPTYAAEEQLVLCGISDNDCNNAVLKDLLSKVDSTPGDINTEVQMDLQGVTTHIMAIRVCVMPN